MHANSRLKFGALGILGAGFLVIVVALVLMGSTTVDATEHCVMTRFGDPIQEKMSTGWSFMLVAQKTCFPLIVQNFPVDPERPIPLQAQTADPLTISGDVAIEWSYDPLTIFEVFLEKRSHTAAEAVVYNAIREGYRTAMAGWYVECDDGTGDRCLEIFSNERVFLSDSVKAHIERKLVTERGVPLARISNVFIRDIDTPPAIEQMRIAAVRQAQVLDSVRTQYTIDSVSSSRDLLEKTNSATAARLEAQAYAANQELLQLRIAEALADGISKACSGAQVCVLGGSVMDTWTSTTGRR
jgi:hypothetical protein